MAFLEFQRSSLSRVEVLVCVIALLAVEGVYYHKVVASSDLGQEMEELRMHVVDGSGEAYLRLFHDYFGKARILDEVHRAFFEGIGLLAGPDCRKRCEDAGLQGMHHHVPAESVALLEAFVNHRVKRQVLAWSAAIGRHDVGFQNDFLIQDLLVVRVHYPHSHIGQSSTTVRRPRLRHRIRYGLSSTVERVQEAYHSRSAIRLPFQMFEYARQRRKRAALPLPYRCHAPHLDSWLGQPTSALSVWLAIAGVDENNSMCFYPELTGQRLPVSGAQFLGSGVCLPRPTRLEIEDGDLVVFNTDILHSSQLNVSDKTRVALTTRIDSGTPVFSGESLWFVERWYSANEVLSGRWRRKTVRGSARRTAPPTPAPREAARSAAIPAVFRANEVFAVAQADAVKDGEQLVVEFTNTRILILRTGGQLRAFSARCPHDGYRMDDGHHDDCALFCPGHGLEFDIHTGRSRLKRYRLAMFDVSERDGTIFLGTPAST